MRTETLYNQTREAYTQALGEVQTYGWVVGGAATVFGLVSTGGLIYAFEKM